MSVVNGVYEAPDWKNGQAPAISADELNAIAQALTGKAKIRDAAFNHSILMSRKEGSTVGAASVATGPGTIASGSFSHAEGSSTTASKQCAHAEGNSTTASSEYTHAEGYDTTASGQASHAEGVYTLANNNNSHAQGHWNKPMQTGGATNNTTGDAMVIGNGTELSARSNAFRVTFAGAVYGVGSFHTSGADYAEYFEWSDGNPNAEDRVGRFVTLEGDRLKLAGPGDYLLGIVSGNPCIVGNGDEDWLGRWVHDEFDRFVKEYLEEGTELLDIPEGLSDEERLALISAPDVREEDGQYYRITSRVVDYETPSWRLKANPVYDPSQPYIERKDRKEWDTVGMLGVLAVRDDGTCQVNGFCQVAEGGVATAAEGYVPGLTYRVIDRVSDKVVKVVFR